LSTRSLVYLSGLLAAHRVEIGSRWRRLNPGEQALLVLAHLRNGDTYTRLAAGFQVGIATVYRYVREAVDLLAAAAPDLPAAMQVCRAKAFVILDGTLIPIDRIGGTTNRPHYSGKHKRHGVNVQILADPHGELIWASPALPGSIHDLRAARSHGLIDALTRSAVATLADKGYRGARGAVGVPFYGRQLPTRMREVNAAHAKGPRHRRTGGLRPQDLATAHQAALLPATCHRPGRGHPDASPQRTIMRLEKPR
jgi:hypothetical protein